MVFRAIVSPFSFVYLGQSGKPPPLDCGFMKFIRHPTFYPIILVDVFLHPCGLTLHRYWQTKADVQTMKTRIRLLNRGLPTKPCHKQEPSAIPSHLLFQSHFRLRDDRCHNSIGLALGKFSHMHGIFLLTFL